MDSEITLEDKCEHLMNVVVESRKRFGKMCTDYEQKKCLMENKLFDLQLETIANYLIKPKHDVPDLNVDAMCKDSKKFADELIERQKKIDKLQNKLKNAQDIILQLKKDSMNKKLNDPLSAETLLCRAKERADM